MNPAFVLDCSIAMTWLFHEETTPETSELLDRREAETALVPSLWFLEVTNVIALAEKKGRITTTQSETFIQSVQVLAIDVDRESVTFAFSHILPLCRSYGLTSYDAMYLELAIRQNLPLATLDEQLRQAALAIGVPLLGL